MDSKQCAEQAERIKEIIRSKMDAHWKVEWRQAVENMLSQILVFEINKPDEVGKITMCDLAPRYQLCFRGVYGLSIVFGNEIEFIFANWSSEQDLVVSRKMLNLQELPLNLWYSLIFHVAYDNCKQVSKDHGFELPRLCKNAVDDNMDDDNQMWVPAQHYLPAVFSNDFAYVLPDRWISIPKGGYGYILDGKMNWDNNWKLKICSVISVVQCEQIVNHLFALDNSINYQIATVFCKGLVRQSLAQFERISIFSTSPFFEQHPIIWPSVLIETNSTNSTNNSTDDESQFNIYEHVFGGTNSFIELVKPSISQSEMDKMMKWIYTCYGENYDIVCNLSNAFPSAADDFSDPLNLCGILSTTQAAKTLDYFRDANISVFSCLSSPEQLSSRLPTALAKLTCCYLQFPSAKLATLKA